MLAYVFWHRPDPGVAAAGYEARLRQFHTRLRTASASFRIDALPFAEQPGYEDWYLVGSWAELGELNARAVSGERTAPHDAVAELASDGWGAVYRLTRGDCRPPMTTCWVSKPAGKSYEAFLAGLQAPSVWQRQTVLGPAPEFCLVDRERIVSHPRARIRTPIYCRFDTGTEI